MAKPPIGRMKKDGYRLGRIEYNRLYRLAHPHYDRDRLRRTRQKAIALYGGKCAKCGFDDWRALQFDHVNGDGRLDRRGRGGSESYLRRILKDKTGKYQLLCANCNWIKRYENSEN